MQNLILYITCVLVWSSTWIAIKFQLGTVDPLLSVSYRFAFAGLIILAFLAATRRLQKIAFTRKQWIYLIVQAFLMFYLNYWLFYLTSEHLTSGLVAVTLSTITVMNIFNQAVFFGIRVHRQVVIASLFGLAGILGVFWHEVQALSFHDETFMGIMLGLFATYTASLGNILSYRNSRDGMPIIQTTMIGMFIGSAFSFAIAMLYGAPLAFEFTPGYMLSLTYLALFGSAIGFGAYFTLMDRIGAGRAAYTAVVIPVVALLISTVFEQYTWTWQAFVGIGLILVGNILALTKPGQLKSLARSVLLKKNPA